MVSEDHLQLSTPESLEWSEILHALEMPAAQALQLDILLLFEFDRDSEQSPMFVLRAATGDMGQETRIPVDETILSAMLDITREFSLTADIPDSFSKLRPLPSILIEQGYVSALIAPIRYGEGLMGCLAGCTRHHRNFSPAELSIFSLFASYVGATMENSHLQTEAAFRLSEAMSLETVSSALVEERTLDAILTIIIDEARRVLNARDALVLLLEEDNQWFRVSAR